MIKQLTHKKDKILVLTRREMEVIQKKLQHKKLNQQDSNYLSRYVRPKLKGMASINAESLLKKLNYNQKAKATENKIKNLILKQIKGIEAVIIYGSAIQTNYTHYQDIDILIITKKKFWKTSREKYKFISLLKESEEKIGLLLDIQIVDKKSFYYQYSSNPSLLYQLKDHKIIYGRIKRLDKKYISKIDLRMKLDWSDLIDEYSEGNEIYYAIRNTVLVGLLAEGIIDNDLLQKKIVEYIGIILLTKLKNNLVSNIEKKIALDYLKELTEGTRKKIMNKKWEKIILSNH